MTVMCSELEISFGKNVEKVCFYFNSKKISSKEMVTFVKNALKEVSIPYEKVSAWNICVKDTSELSTKESIIGELKENADFLRSLSSPQRKLVKFGN